MFERGETDDGKQAFYISGIPCEQCGMVVRNIGPIPFDIPEGDEWRREVECPRGHTFDFVFDVVPDADDRPDGYEMGP
jgi:hypothetical protein